MDLENRQEQNKNILRRPRAGENTHDFLGHPGEASREKLGLSLNFAFGRRVRLQGSPREGPESGRKPAFLCERGVRLPGPLLPFDIGAMNGR